ncbi:MAG: class II glutamine amidotransferase [Myxococcales bacterium]|nr:class II glutamine amidotransferase [Myxococcales bacterium]MCB9708731.1 class II glutamine amidotransferase [Myxococcales bacterium]
MARASSRFSQALEHEPLEATLVSLGTVPYGWGVGFYHGDEVLHIKRPHSEDVQFNWQNAIADIVSDCVVAHVREPSIGAFRAENTHPFRMRQWLFAHAGILRGFDEARSTLTSALPDFLRHNIRGETDSEIFFHMILAELFAQGQLDVRDPAPTDVIAAVRTARERLNDVSPSQSEPHVLNIVLTNGRQMLVVHQGPPVAFVQRQPHTVERSSSALKHSPAPDYVLAACGLTELPPGYAAVPDHHVLAIDRDLRVSLHPL